MPNRSLTVSIPHDLSPDEVRRRIQNGIADARQRFAGKIGHVEEKWTADRLDFQLSAVGQSVSGFVDVQPKAVTVSVDLPWFLAVLAEKIRPQIEKEGAKLLEKSGQSPSPPR